MTFCCLKWLNFVVCYFSCTCLALDLLNGLTSCLSRKIMVCVVASLLRCDDIDIGLTRSKFNNWSTLVFTYVFKIPAKHLLTHIHQKG
jgi:hypothetical protein